MTAYDEFKKLNLDSERWQWLLDNPEVDYQVYLDNDDTFVTFDGHDDVISFDEYIGRSYGVVTLLDVLGINTTDA